MNRKVMMIAGLLVLALGGGGGAYFYLAGAKKEPPHPVAPPPPPPPVFVSMEPLNVPLWRGERVAGFYLVAVNMQVADDAGRKKVEQQMPRLRDAILMDINSHPMVRKNDPNSIDLGELKAHLQGIADRILGKGTVQDVLIVRAMRMS